MIRNVVILAIAIGWLGGCAALPQAISLSSTHFARKDAQKNFQLAEEYRLQQDYEMAFQHYRYSALGGNREAAMWVAKYYFDGVGTPRDYYRARRVFEMIAWQDKEDMEDEVYLYLADIDFYGKGRPRMVVQGYKWMLIGTRNTPSRRFEMKAQMEPEMKERHIAKATRFAKKWLAWRDRDYSGIE